MGTTFAAWTGYSYIIIGQRRLPRLQDNLNVFILALGLLGINSTLGQASWMFFLAVCLYLLGVMYTVFYNFTTMRDMLPYPANWRDDQWLAWVLVPFIVVSGVASYLAYNGHLDERAEIAVALFLNVQHVAWIWVFYRWWKNMLRKSSREDSGTDV